MSVWREVRDGSPDWWESPDIWVVPGTDPQGSPGAPVGGRTTFDPTLPCPLKSQATITVV